MIKRSIFCIILLLQIFDLTVAAILFPAPLFAFKPIEVGCVTPLPSTELSSSDYTVFINNLLEHYRRSISAIRITQAYPGIEAAFEVQQLKRNFQDRIVLDASKILKIQQELLDKLEITTLEDKALIQEINNIFEFLKPVTNIPNINQMLRNQRRLNRMAR